jgi:hypothetical protein
MPISSPAGAENFVLQSAIGAYADEAYTSARKLVGTGITSPNPMIKTDTETFVGQMRWFKPLNPKVNTASLTDRTSGEKTNYATDYSQYIKTVRTHGAEKVNMQEVVTQADGLAKIGRDFAETKASDENGALFSVLKAVSLAEALTGAASASGVAGLGGQTFDNDPADKRYGFYVDLGTTLITAPTVYSQGAQRAEGIFNAFGMAYKDYEPDYAYLVISPSTMASFRSANLVDENTITESNTQFTTIFDGKFRLVMTRGTTSFTAAEKTKINSGSGIDIVGTRTSYVILPGSIAMENLNVPTPTEIWRDPDAFHGGGTTTVWYRWGYVMHPAGYTWAGNDQQFPSDADFTALYAAGGQVQLLDPALVNVDTARGSFVRKASALNLGILPIFHN